MKNYSKQADVLTWLNNTGSAVASGAVVRVGAGLFGIAVTDIANGATGALQLTGQVILLKATGVVFAAGDPLFWSGTNCNKIGTNPRIGTAVAAEIAGATTCTVLLQPTILGDALSGQAEVVQFKFTTTGSNASPHVLVDAAFPFKAEIVDVTVQCTATVSDGTVQLDDGTTAITDAIIAATANAVTRAGTIAQATKTINAGGTLRAVKHATANAAVIYVTVRKVP